ncbi:Neutral alpha-glucosidase AB [Tritrichomonas foetus]|uniref:Glucosidase II subunit alpha n=1 Tax=Tritrichomonas foetus TaxID=1144522 RepID=A0A1J4KKV1_9EUKA|nr:Neutral alpha-glucosidase AB [Tritrichomonas foetus]|eukprot:OHT11770.1 Neutral alpha-glucosidase AB [Tritrichomonas foetus]
MITFSMFLFITFCISAEPLKLCNDMGFCSRNINLTNKWTIKESSIRFEKDEFSAQLINNGEDAQLILKIYLMQSNTFRVQILPTNTENFNRYKISENPQVVNQNILNQHLPLTYSNEIGIHCLVSEKCKAEINIRPFEIKIIDEFNSTIILNKRQELVYEHFGQKVEPDIWRYRNDTIKNGATAVSLDFNFAGANTRLSGYSESFDDMNFNDTFDEPVRMANFDYFSYYGHIPFVYGHSSKEMIAFFWLNPSDSVLKIGSDVKTDTRYMRVISEGGFIDTFIFTGKLKTILSSYTELTGHIEVPAISTLGYHQSKWGYKNQSIFESVIDRLNKISFPFDYMWMDVDHLANHAPFYFDRNLFPNPSAIFEKLAKQNRFLIRLNDPHLPNSTTHQIAVDALRHGYFVNESDGKTRFIGNCWPGMSSWPDFLNPEVRNWWSTHYKYTVNETAPNVFFWNDMDEPSVFDMVEGTLPKDTLLFGNHEFREIRNVYALMMHYSTYLGVVNRNEDKNTRPFILTRGYFAGSQKYAFMWSGDNYANFDNLRKSVSMTLVAGLCGMPLTGSDLGGFNDNPSEELLYRWYQAGSLLYPLYRSHCHEDSDFKEPYLYDSHIQELLLNATKLRYSLIPTFYTAIFESHMTGKPPVQPLFSIFPEIEELHDIQEQYILGESLMAAPVLYEDLHILNVSKPPGRWFDYYTGKLLENDYNELEVTDSSFPLYIRGGKIISRFSKTGQTVNETIKNPLTLIVACNEKGEASGSLYFDDGVSYNYRQGKYLYRKIVYKKNTLSFFKAKNVGNEDENENSDEIPEEARNLTITSIVFYGLKGLPALIDDDTVVSCVADRCVMKNINLHPFEYSEEESGKKSNTTLYIILGSVAGGIILIVIVAVVIRKCIKKKKEENAYETL